MRILAILVLCAVSVPTIAADPEVLPYQGNGSTQQRIEALRKQNPLTYAAIDLSRQDAREALRESNPTAYAKAIQLLEAASKLSCERDGLKALQVQLQIQAVDCRSLVFKTSYPAKRDIHFVIDGQRYYSLVKVVDAKGQLVPVIPAK